MKDYLNYNLQKSQEEQKNRRNRLNNYEKEGIYAIFHEHFEHKGCTGFIKKYMIDNPELE